MTILVTMKIDDKKNILIPDYAIDKNETLLVISGNKATRNLDPFLRFLACARNDIDLDLGGPQRVTRRVITQRNNESPYCVICNSLFIHDRLYFSIINHSRRALYGKSPL